jgi:hypothetical protein
MRQVHALTRVLMTTGPHSALSPALLRRRDARLLLALFFLALLAGPVAAQRGDTGTIAGYVYDQTGSPLAGVKVTAASSTQIGGSRSTYTNAEGFFRFPGLFPGEFVVRASAPKMNTVEQRAVRVGLNAPVELTLVMNNEREVEQVTIIQKAPIVNTSKASQSVVFDADFVEGLPHDNRDNVFGQMINSVPGVVNGRMRGGTTNQTVFTQDGFEMRNQFPTLKSSAAYEVQVSGYGADNAAAAGGLVNLVTKSGSNKWEFELNATADAAQLRFFQDTTDRRGSRSYQYVLAPSISGPIVRDRLWFHFNTEAQIRKTERPTDVEGLLPDPLPSYTWVAKGTFKLTWQVAARHKVENLYSFDIAANYNRKDGLGIDRAAQEHRDLRRGFAGLTWQALLSDAWLLRNQVGLYTNPEYTYPTLCLEDPACLDIPGVIQRQPRTQEYNGLTTNVTRQDRVGFQTQNRLEGFLTTKRFGDHGIAVKNAFYAENFTAKLLRPGDMVTEYNGLAPAERTFYYANDPRRERERTGWFIQGLNVRRNMSTVSETWRPTRHLTFTPAISYVWAQAGNNMGASVLRQKTWTPAVGVTWDATHDGRTALRAGFSSYADVNIDTLIGIARHTLGGQVAKRCKYNAASSEFDVDCQYSGGRTSATVGQPCGPTGLTPDGRPCQEALKIPRIAEYTLGAEREITTGVALSVDGSYKRYRNEYEMRETNRIWSASGEELDRAGAYRNGRSETVVDIGTPDQATRRYMGLTVGASKREGKLRTQAFYTWSKMDGTIFNERDNEIGDIPGRDIYLSSFLPLDHRHEVKLSMVYQWTNWLSSGMRYEYLSGMPYSRLFRNSETTRFESYRARRGYDPGSNINDPGDDRQLRLPDQQTVNVQARVKLQPLIGQQIDLYVDILNALALRSTTAVGQEDGRDFGIGRSRMEPFRVRLGAEFRF